MSGRGRRDGKNIPFALADENRLHRPDLGLCLHAPPVIPYYTSPHRYDMKGLPIPLQSNAPALGMGLALFLLILTQAGLALAQDQEMPPFPILYGGRALMDGQPLPEGTRLEARIRDYVTWTSVLQDGNYRSLLVGPPSRDYYLGTVTFHALGVTAQEQDVFRPAGAPDFKDVGFDLHFPPSPTLVSPQPSPTHTPTVEPSPQPSPTPSPTLNPAATPQNSKPPEDISNGSSVLRLAVGAGVVLVVLAGWYVLQRRWDR